MALRLWAGPRYLVAYLALDRVPVEGATARGPTARSPHANTSAGPRPAAVALMAVVITLLLGLGQDRIPPTLDSAAATPSSSPLLTPAALPGEERVPATFPTEQRLPFQPPVELQSANGLLRTAFTVEPRGASVPHSRERLLGDGSQWEAGPLLQRAGHSTATGAQ